MIEGDYIQLREGAQKMIVATAAAAKVAAAAASSPYPSYLPTVAVTPMAQSHRLKKAPSVDSKNVKIDKSGIAVISPNVTDDPLNHQQTNGICSNVGLANANILSKSKDSHKIDGPENRGSIGNRGNVDRSSMSSAQNSGSANGRLTSSFVGKQQTRYTSTLPLERDSCLSLCFSASSKII